MGRFDGKVVLVTGAAGAGIGQEVARSFAREGANVVIGDAHASRPFSVAADIQKTLKVKALGFQCDVSNVGQVKKMVQGTLDAFGRIDVLVNNAGINKLSPIVDMPDEVWDLVINVNLKGTFYCTREVMRAMIKQKSGVVISLSSIAGWLGEDDGQSHYCAAKAAIQAFTRCVAAEGAPHGIRAYAIAPGVIWNEFLTRIYPPEKVSEWKTKVPLGRLGQPPDIANVMKFLASDDAAFITGETICVSGGVYMHV